MSLEDEVATSNVKASIVGTSSSVSVDVSASVLDRDSPKPRIYNVFVINSSRPHRAWIEDLISAYYKLSGNSHLNKINFGYSEHAESKDYLHVPGARTDLVVFYLTATPNIYSTIEQLRKYNPDTPIIVISALPKSHLDKQKLIDAGIKRRDVFVERVDIRKLWKRLEYYCPK